MSRLQLISIVLAASLMAGPALRWEPAADACLASHTGHSQQAHSGAKCHLRGPFSPASQPLPFQMDEGRSSQFGHEDDDDESTWVVVFPTACKEVSELVLSALVHASTVTDRSLQAQHVRLQI